MEVTGTIKPRPIDLIGYIDHQRVAFPVSDGPAHPRIRGNLRLAIQVDDASGARKFIRDQDLVGSLNHLKRQTDISGARNSRQKAFSLRVAGSVVGLDVSGMGEPLLKVFLLLGRRPRLIGDLAAFDYALPRWFGANGAEEGGKWRHSRGMRLEVPISRVEGLPNAVQIGGLGSG